MGLVRSSLGVGSELDRRLLGVSWGLFGVCPELARSLLGVSWGLFGVRSELARLFGVSWGLFGVRPEFARSLIGVRSELPGVDSELARSSSGDARSCLGTSPGFTPDRAPAYFWQSFFGKPCQTKFLFGKVFPELEARRRPGAGSSTTEGSRGLPNKIFVWQGFSRARG